MSAVSNRLDETEMRAVKWKQSFIIKAFHSEPPLESHSTVGTVLQHKEGTALQCSNHY